MEPVKPEPLPVFDWMSAEAKADVGVYNDDVEAATVAMAGMAGGKAKLVAEAVRSDGGGASETMKLARQINLEGLKALRVVLRLKGRLVPLVDRMIAESLKERKRLHEAKLARLREVEEEWAKVGIPNVATNAPLEKGVRMLQEQHSQVARFSASDGNQIKRDNTNEVYVAMAEEALKEAAGKLVLF